MRSRESKSICSRVCSNERRIVSRFFEIFEVEDNNDVETTFLAEDVNRCLRGFSLHRCYC